MYLTLCPTLLAGHHSKPAVCPAECGPEYSTQSIAHVILSENLSELSADQTDHVTPSLDERDFFSA